MDYSRFLQLKILSKLDKFNQSIDAKLKTVKLVDDLNLIGSDSSLIKMFDNVAFLNGALLDNSRLKFDVPCKRFVFTIDTVTKETISRYFIINKNISGNNKNVDIHVIYIPDDNYASILEFGNMVETISGTNKCITHRRFGGNFKSLSDFPAKTEDGHDLLYIFVAIPENFDVVNYKYEAITDFTDDGPRTKEKIKYDVIYDHLSGGDRDMIDRPMYISPNMIPYIQTGDICIEVENKESRYAIYNSNIMGCALIPIDNANKIIKGELVELLTKENCRNYAIF